MVGIVQFVEASQPSTVLKTWTNVDVLPRAGEAIRIKGKLRKVLDIEWEESTHVVCKMGWV